MRHTRSTLLTIAAITISGAYCVVTLAADETPSATAPAKPEMPTGLKVGDKAPDANLPDANGKQVKLSSLWQQRPIVVTFYRGGWCPFCTKSLAGWEEKLPELTAAGATLVAITPEKLEHALKTGARAKLTYSILVDESGDTCKSYKVLFELDPATREKYKSYGIDLPERNADGKWDLPVPATYLIDTTGTIRWVYFNPDYTKRAEPDDVIKAAKELTIK